MTPEDRIGTLTRHVAELKAKITELEASVSEKEELFETLQAGHELNNKRWRNENPGLPQGDTDREYFDKD